MNVFNTFFPLSGLLPYDLEEKKNGALEKCVDDYNLLIASLEKTLDAIVCKNYEQFDALVGENACQIRATRIAIEAKSALEDIPALKKEICLVKARITAITNPKLLRKTFQQLLNERQLNINISDTISFCLQAYLLTYTKTMNLENSTVYRKDEKLVPKKLMEISKVNASFADSLIKRTRQRMSMESVNYVRRQAILAEDPKLINMTENRFEAKINSWSSLPMFWVYKILLQSARRNAVPLLFIAKFYDKKNMDTLMDIEKIYFRYSEEQDRYEEADPSSLNLDQPIICIQGAVSTDEQGMKNRDEWRQKITSNNVKVILKGAADHRQYPDVEEETRLKEVTDFEYTQMRIAAKAEGFSIDNPSAFLVQHVYPSTPQKQQNGGAEWGA